MDINDTGMRYAKLLKHWLISMKILKSWKKDKRILYFGCRCSYVLNTGVLYSGNICPYAFGYRCMLILQII